MGDEFTAAMIAVADDPAGLDRLIELAESGDVEAVAEGDDEDDLAESASGPKGPPPFPGAVFDPGRHRWVKADGDDSASEKLASMPETKGKERWFNGNYGPEVSMTAFGFAGKGKGFGAHAARAESAVMTLDPSQVKFTQTSVTKDLVAKKMADPNASGGLDKGPVLVVKDGEEYHLQGGNHRAAAEILRTGKFTANVVETDGKDRGGNVRFKKPGTVN